MIQLNLLPDVKMEYLRIRRLRRLVMSVCLITSLVCGVILIIGFSVTFGAQKLAISNTQKSIDSNLKELQSIEDLDKILTVQNQRTTLDTLHASKPVLSRLFTYPTTERSIGFLTQLVPTAIRISNFDVSSSSDTSVMTFSGNADSLTEINQFVDTLKFAEYKVEGSDQMQKVFTTVVLESYGVGKSNVAYSIKATYDPIIFSGDKSVELSVPVDKQTTRSILERPTFIEQEAPENTEGGTN